MLVPLFVGRLGDVYVLLSRCVLVRVFVCMGTSSRIWGRRSDALRAFAGDTALPGGRVDVLDETIEDAAVSLLFRFVGIS